MLPLMWLNCLCHELRRQHATKVDQTCVKRPPISMYKKSIILQVLWHRTQTSGMGLNKTDLSIFKYIILGLIFNPKQGI